MIRTELQMQRLPAFSGLSCILSVFLLTLCLPRLLDAEVITQIQVVREGQQGVTGLSSPHSARVSPDGAYVYVLGGGGTLIAFERAPSTGILQFKKAYYDGNGVTGEHWLATARSLAVSPLGDFLILACGQGAHLFARDKSSGEVNSVHRIKNGWWGAEGVEGLEDTVFSPDQSHVYTVSSTEHALATFALESDSGFLTFVETLRDGVDGVQGLREVHSISISPDGMNVYAVGRSISEEVQPAAFTRHPETGRLSYLPPAPSEPPPPILGGIDTIAVSPDGNNVYVAAHNVSDAMALILTFSRNKSNGQLTYTSLFAVDPMPDTNVWQKDSIAFTPDGRYLFTIRAVIDDGADSYSILLFKRNLLDGSLRLIRELGNQLEGVHSLSGLVSLTVSNDGRTLYSNAVLDQTLSAFSINHIFQSDFEGTTQ